MIEAVILVAWLAILLLLTRKPEKPRRRDIWRE